MTPYKILGSVLGLCIRSDLCVRGRGAREMFRLTPASAC